MFNNYLNEFLGTLFFTYVILVIKEPVAIALALLTAILASKSGSTAHFNPAVSIAVSSKSSMPMEKLMYLIFSQVAGALVAVELTKTNLGF